LDYGFLTVTLKDRMFNFKPHQKVLAASLIFVTSAFAQAYTKTADTFSDCYSVISQIDQDGLLRAFAEGQDGDEPTFGLFKLTDQGDVDLNMDSKNRGTVSTFALIDGTRVLKASRNRRLGIKTDNIEHYFTFSSNKLTSMFVTGTYQKGSAFSGNDGGGNRWGLNFTFKVDPVNNTCALSRVTIGLEGAPKAYLPKHGTMDASVAFELKACKDFLDLQAKWPDSQYCDRPLNGPASTQDLNDEEVARLQAAKVINDYSVATPSFVNFCKSFHSAGDTQKTLKIARTQAGSLCSSSEKSIVDYTQNYYSAHPVAAVGGATTPANPSSVNQAQ
jgi:hypothetical protein